MHLLVLMMAISVAMDRFPHGLCSCDTNLALNRPAHASTPYTGRDPSLAVDGVKVYTVATACTGTLPETNARFSVDLGYSVNVHHVVLYNDEYTEETANRLQNFKIFVGDIAPDVLNYPTDVSSLQLCYHFPGIATRYEVFNLNCTAEARGRYVYVVNGAAGAEYLHICELEVYAHQAVAAASGWEELTDCDLTTDISVTERMNNVTHQAQVKFTSEYQSSGDGEAVLWLKGASECPSGRSTLPIFKLQWITQDCQQQEQHQMCTLTNSTTVALQDGTQRLGCRYQCEGNTACDNPAHPDLMLSIFSVNDISLEICEVEFFGGDCS